MAELKLSARQERLLAEAKQQHYVVAPAGWGTRDGKLRGAYYRWCQERPWCPYIRVSLGSRYAIIDIDTDVVHDETGMRVVGRRRNASDQVFAIGEQLFRATTDRWAEDAAIAGCFFARGMPIDLVPQFIADVWPVLSVPGAYITGNIWEES